jgi:hypothetical protein
VVSGDGASGASWMLSNPMSWIGKTTATTEAIVTFFGGPSTFLKLGACDAVSSLCPTRVSAGTHTSTRTPSTTAVRASSNPNRWVRRGVSTELVVLL